MTKRTTEQSFSLANLLPNSSSEAWQGFCHAAKEGSLIAPQKLAKIIASGHATPEKINALDRDTLVAIAICFAQALGVEKDEQKALELYQKAACKDSFKAKVVLEQTQKYRRSSAIANVPGWTFQGHEGEKARLFAHLFDSRPAEAWQGFSHGARVGDQRSYTDLAVMIAEGKASPEQIKKLDAEILIKVARCFAEGMTSNTDKTIAYAKDEGRACQLYCIAAEKGSQTAQFEFMHLQSKMIADRDRHIIQLKTELEEQMAYQEQKQAYHLRMVYKFFQEKIDHERGSREEQQADLNKQIRDIHRELKKEVAYEKRGRSEQYRFLSQKNDQLEFKLMESIEHAQANTTAIDHKYEMRCEKIEGVQQTLASDLSMESLLRRANDDALMKQQEDNYIDLTQKIECVHEKVDEEASQRKQQGEMLAQEIDRVQGNLNLETSQRQEQNETLALEIDRVQGNLNLETSQRQEQNETLALEIDRVQDNLNLETSQRQEQTETLAQEIENTRRDFAELFAQLQTEQQKLVSDLWRESQLRKASDDLLIQQQERDHTDLTQKIEHVEAKVDEKSSQLQELGIILAQKIENTHRVFAQFFAQLQSDLEQRCAQIEAMQEDHLEALLEEARSRQSAHTQLSQQIDGVQADLSVEKRGRQEQANQLAATIHAIQQGSLRKQEAIVNLRGDLERFKSESLAQDQELQSFQNNLCDALQEELVLRKESDNALAAQMRQMQTALEERFTRGQGELSAEARALADRVRTLQRSTEERTVSLSTQARALADRVSVLQRSTEERVVSLSTRSSQLESGMAQQRQIHERERSAFSSELRRARTDFAEQQNRLQQQLNNRLLKAQGVMSNQISNNQITLRRLNADTEQRLTNRIDESSSAYLKNFQGLSGRVQNLIHICKNQHRAQNLDDSYGFFAYYEETIKKTTGSIYKYSDLLGKYLHLKKVIASDIKNLK